MSNNTKLRQIIYDKIVDEISSGKIVVGERLNERELAKKFNASRTPVREALIQLEKVGVIVINHNKGAMVRKVTRKQMEESFDIISILEGYAVETTVAGGISEKDIIYIKKLEKEMNQAVKEKNYFKFPQLNQKFHDFFVKKTRNKILQDVLNVLNSTVYSGGLSVPFFIDQYMAKHTIIIDALLKGLPMEAAKAMKDHDQERKKYVDKTLGEIKKYKSVYRKN